MRRLIHTVLVGVLVLVTAFGHAQTHESIELQTTSTPNEQSQPDSNEKLKALSAEIHEKALDTQILTTTKGLLMPDTSNEKADSSKTDTSVPLSNAKVNSTTNTEDPSDVSLERSSLDSKSQVMESDPVHEIVDPAALVINEKATSDEIELTTQMTKAVTGPSRNIIGNRMLQNRLRTTTARNADPILKGSDEFTDSNGKIQTVKSDDGKVETISRKPVFGQQSRIRTTTRRNPISTDSDEIVDTKTTATPTPASRNLFNRIQSTTTVRSDSSDQLEGSSIKTTTARSLPLANRFASSRTSTVNTPTTEDSKEQEDAVKTTQGTTVKNVLPGIRFSRIRTTTVRATTLIDSSERDDLTGTTTVRGTLSENRFSRLRATTTPVATVSKESDEQSQSVTPTPSTTTRSLPRNRFNSFRSTTTSSPVARDSDERTEKVTPTRKMTSPIFIPGNRISRLRISPTRSSTTSTSTVSSDEEIEATSTTTRNLIPANRFSSRIRPTTVSTTKISGDSDERDDSVNGTTTTTSQSSTRNRFSSFRGTPTRTPGDRDSDEQADKVNATQSTTIRNSILRNRFLRTTTTRAPATTISVPTTTADDSSEKEDVMNGTLKTNSTSSERISRMQVTTALDIKSGGKEELVNETLTTTVRNLDSGEKDDLVNSTATSVRSSIFLKYFNRYRTTKHSHRNSDNSDEVIRLNLTSAPMKNTTLRLQLVTLPTASNLTVIAVTALPLETSNLGRKDRAIIYSSAKSDNQLITSTMSTVPVETTHLTPAIKPPVRLVPKGYYTFASSDEMDDSSEDEDDVSRAPYYDPYYGVPQKDTSLEVDDVSSEMEMNGNVTDKADENSSEVPSKVTDVQHVYLHPNGQEDVSIEMALNHPHQRIQNQTFELVRHGYSFPTAESGEGNDGSVEEKEGSGDAMEENENENENENEKNSTSSTIQEQSTKPAKESGEGNDASKEKEPSTDVPDENLKEKNKNTTNTAKDEEVSTNSDENEENSSLEIDMSKLTDIQLALTEGKTDQVVVPDIAPELQRFFTDAKPVDLILEDQNRMATTASVISRKIQNESVIRPSNEEVTMKLKELLTNPVVQQRLEAIDGRLKSTKSARVKRLIEKYLAALAKLSTNSASASTSFSVFLPLLLTCLLFGFS